MITLAIYIGLNAVFLVIAIFLAPGFPLDDIFYIISSLFGKPRITPDSALVIAIYLPFAPDLIIGLFSLLAITIPPLVAVIIGARIGDSGKISFLSWFLTAVLSSIVYFLLVFFGQDASLNLLSLWSSFEFIYGYIGAILYMIIGGVVNGFFYGCFSFLFSRD